MRVALIYRVNVASSDAVGVVLKMNGQQKAFAHLGYDCIAYYHRDGEIIKRSHNGKEEIISSVTYRRRSFSFKDFFNILLSEESIDHADLIYIRYPFSTPAFLNFVRRFRKEQVVIEMPTYPYDKEWSGLAKMFLRVDKYYSNKLKHYCHSIVHFGKEDKIFGIKTIQSANGIDTKSFPLVQNQNVDGLKMITVGNFNYWHGLDRLIKGMGKSQNKNIQLNIVGDGTIIPDLQELVNHLELEGKVKFCGVKRGKELDVLFDKSNLGIGTLGIHRKEVSINSSLKHREYASRGIPFIYAGDDPDFENASWTHKISATEESVDIDSVSQFLEKVKTSNTAIKNFASDNLDWKIKLEGILAKC